jgi:hypothetical protein
MAFAIRPPIGKYVPAVPPVAIRKKVMSWASVGEAASAVPRPPSNTLLRLILILASSTGSDLTLSHRTPQRRPVN